MTAEAKSTNLPSFYRVCQCKEGSLFNGPDMVFDHYTGVYMICGSADPKSSHVLFEELIEWLSTADAVPPMGGELIVRLKFFNTTSALYLLKIFRKWLKLHADNTITWMHEADDELMKEAGTEYRSLLNERFSIVARLAPSFSKRSNRNAAII
ncbi:MAG: hypothetical protein Kow0075_12230 [Salibacteraceae bacterium]